MADSKQIIGTQMVGRDGEEIGAVERVFSKDSTGEPAWVTVRTGVMRREHVIPLEGSQSNADSIHVPFTQDMVKNSPKLEFDDHLSTDDIKVLSQYYGTTAQAAKPRDTTAKPVSGAPMPAGTGDASAPGVKVPQDLHRDATLEAVRYGERLQVAKESREAGRVKLRTYVEQTATEQKVELHRETVEVERVPITDTARFTGEQPDWAEQMQEIVLFAEQAHVSKEVVPLERIIVRKKMISEEQVLRDSVRTQQFEVVEPSPEDLEAKRPSTSGAAGAGAARAAAGDSNRR
jgi:stress response protein YsnF